MPTTDKRAVVKRTGRTWSVFVDGVLVEGGFFEREWAEESAEDLKRGGYPVPGSNRTPIAKHKVAGQPILPPPTDEDVKRIRKMLDDRYGKERT